MDVVSADEETRRDLALDADRACTPASRDLASRIEEGLASRCTEPGLCADDIAAMVGVSVRTLHRALAASQRTFAGRLMHHRMQRARRMLESPAFDRVTTAEVGRRVTAASEALAGPLA